MYCDFCYPAKEVDLSTAWFYDCEDFQMAPGLRSTGPWVACELHCLIIENQSNEKDRINALLRGLRPRILAVSSERRHYYIMILQAGSIWSLFFRYRFPNPPRRFTMRDIAVEQRQLMNKL